MRGLILTSLTIFACSQYAQAQSCSPVNTETAACNAMVEASQVLEARAGIGLAGGNPVPGASSTLGMRIGHIPRISVAARITGVGLDMPGINRGESDFKALGHSTNFDAAVALFSGFGLLPT